MKRFLFLLLWLLPSGLFSRDNGRFRHYTTEDGLPQNSIHCMVQDGQGFMWIGTSDGLCRYDGYRFRIFRPDPSDSSTISNNVVRCLLVDHTGKLWAGTRDGLNCYDPVTGKFKRFYADPKDKNSLSENVVLALAEDVSGKIWAATLSSGVSIFDPATGKFRQLRHRDGDPSTICGNDVRGICADRQGHLWLATWKSGVCEYDPVAGRQLTYIAPEQLGFPNTRGAIACDSKGRVWIGTWLNGLDLWDTKTRKLYHETENTPQLPDLKTGMIWMLRLDAKERLLIATAEQGLIIFDPNTGARRQYGYDPDDPWALNDKSVWSIQQDRSGQLWAGTWRGGINVLDERLARFDLLRFDPKDTNSLPAATAWSVCSDGRNGLWIGTAAGPVHYDPATQRYRRPALFPQDPQGPPANCDIQALCCDRRGDAWMGSAGNGIFRYDTVVKKFRHYQPDRSKPGSVGDEIISALCCDEKGQVWVAAGHSPLQRYDPATDAFVNYPFDAADSLAEAIYCIARAGKDELVLGLLTGEVFRFNTVTGKFTRLWKNPAAIGVNSVYADKFGGVWAGTNGSGLVYLKDGRATFFTEKDGLPNNVINSIAAGAKDELWLGTNGGLCRFDPIVRSVRLYTSVDGLQGNEFNQGAFARTPDGKLWFGGVKGVSAFYPKDILPNPAPAPAVITAFSVLNKPFALPQDILYTKDIALTYRDYFFSFDFAGLEFTNPQRNQYKYMMEGFDADWIDAGSRRFVTYTNLDPGEYTFRVKASNNDGYWSDAVTEVRISISPPFWRTNWFYASCGAVLLLSGWGFVRWRERKLRLEKLVLETKVTERTAELRQEKEKVTAAHKDIRDSINYAQRIQYALLAHDVLLKKNLREYFVLFRPKDVVSGDFYWATARDGKFYLAVCDSTGHGVPGAFMSLLNISFLNEAINEKQIADPGEVFNHVRKRLVEHISQEGGQDGMDAILAVFGPGEHNVRYAAAHNAPVIIRGNEILQPEADKMPVGKGERTESFSTRTMQLQPGDVVYFYTDGFGDQFGGPKGKKFKESNLRRLLAEIAAWPAEEQKAHLAAKFDDWKGELEQIDDVLLVGVRIG